MWSRIQLGDYNSITGSFLPEARTRHAFIVNDACGIGWLDTSSNHTGSPDKLSWHAIPRLLRQFPSANAKHFPLILLLGLVVPQLHDTPLPPGPCNSLTTPRYQLPSLCSFPRFLIHSFRPSVHSFPLVTKRTSMAAGAQVLKRPVYFGSFLVTSQVPTESHLVERANPKLTGVLG